MKTNFAKALPVPSFQIHPWRHIISNALIASLEDIGYGAQDLNNQLKFQILLAVV